MSGAIATCAACRYGVLDRDLYVMSQRHADVPVSLELYGVCCSDGVITAMELVQQCPLD